MNINRSQTEAMREWERMGQGCTAVGTIFILLALVAIVIWGPFKTPEVSSRIVKFDGVTVSDAGMGLETSYLVIPINAPELPSEVKIWHIGKPVAKGTRVQCTATIAYNNEISYNM